MPGPTAITTRANDTFRDHETYGLPGTGDHEPAKADIRADFAALDTVISTLGVAGGGANGVPVYCDGTNWRIG